MKKQKILIVHNYYQIPGGEDTVAANEKKMLEEAGHQVFTYYRSNSELKTMGIMRKVWLPFTTIFNIRTYREVKKMIKKNNIGIVHVHNTLNLISPSVYYAAFHCKVPVVQTIHNFRLLCPAATFYRDGKICEECVSKGLKCAVKHSCYRGSRLQTLACVISTLVHRRLKTYRRLNYICLTEFNKNKLLMLNRPGKKPVIRPERVFVKPNFADFVCETETDGQSLVQNTVRSGFVFAGRLDKQKGVKVLFKAWKCMGADAPDLVVCGTGPEEAWCREYIETNRLASVKMLGFVEQQEVKKIMAVSKALILPTQWYEGFPMSILEAFSVGTPVIGSDIGNVGNIIINGVNGYRFCYNSSRDLAEKVQTFQEIAPEKIVEYSKERYSAAANYKKLKKIYDRVIEDGM